MNAPATPLASKPAALAAGMTAAEAAVETLAANGIEVVFGIPGGHSFPIYAALAKNRKIRHVLGRHEQGLGFMADGYYRASGKIAAVSITSGPAVANVAGTLGQATTDTSAVLVVASAPASALIGKNRGGLHDLNDAIDMVRPLCRYAEHCATADEVSPKIAGVIGRLRHRRPGGAFVQIPTDVMASRVNSAAISPVSLQALRPDQPAVDQAAALLRAARRPLIVAGTGAVTSHAGAMIRDLAARIGAVVTTSTLARGIVPGSDPNVFFPDGPSATAVNEIYERADVVLAVGTMFKQEDTCNWAMKMGGRLIHIDIDPEELGRSYPVTVGINSDAAAACRALLAVVPRSHAADPAWAAFAQEKQRARLAARRVRHPVEMAFIESFRAAIPSDVMMFADRCNIGYWMSRCLPCEEPRTFHYPQGFGGLGGALPQAIGAKLACGSRRIVGIVGDGGMQFTLPELAVAVQERIAVKIVVSNNHSYGAIQAGMNKNYPGLDLGTRVSGPDWGKIAGAYDIPFLRFSDADGFISGLRGELETERLCLIEHVNDLADPQ